LALAWLSALTLSRLVLVLVFHERVAETGGLTIIFLQGLRFDLVLIGALLGPLFLLKPWFHTWKPFRWLGNWFWPLYAAAVTAACFFVEGSSADYIGTFDSRPNYLFVEYLEYPKEVMATVIGTKPIEFLLFTLASAGVAWWSFRWMLRDPFNHRRVAVWFCLLITPLTLVLVFAMIRSTITHRPVNPSYAAFSQDAMVNTLPLNSPYSVLHAIHERLKESSYQRISYGNLADAAVMQIILDEAGIDAAEQLNPQQPTLHFQASTEPRSRPLNLVIVVEESLGAEFVGSLGGKDLTPNLDHLQDKSIWFERLYATGIRSSRGLEAILTGFTPSPQTNVVKRSDTQRSFFTLAGLLRCNGYRTGFIYGCDSSFDNMRRFFLNNGFETVRDIDDYQNPAYKGSWGVSDEDVFNLAHGDLLQTGDEPFLKLIFTTSNHEPFEFPSGRVTSSEYGPRESSIKYADWALGQFIDNARASHYWDNTVFVVIADHNAKIFGGNLVAVERFRIPAAIFGPTVKPQRIPDITSQIDFLPTILSVIGLDTAHPGIGLDLTQPENSRGSGRAMMQFYDNQAYIEEDRHVVVFQPYKEPTAWLLEEEGRLVPDEQPDEERINRALAYAFWGPLTIQNQAYQLDSKTGDCPAPYARTRQPSVSPPGSATAGSE